MYSRYGRTKHTRKAKCLPHCNHKSIIADKRETAEISCVWNLGNGKARHEKTENGVREASCYKNWKCWWFLASSDFVAFGLPDTTGLSMYSWDFENFGFVILSYTDITGLHLLDSGIFVFVIFDFPDATVCGFFFFFLSTLLHLGLPDVTFPQIQAFTTFFQYLTCILLTTIGLQLWVISILICVHFPVYVSAFSISSFLYQHFSNSLCPCLSAFLLFLLSQISRSINFLLSVYLFVLASPTVRYCHEMWPNKNRAEKETSLIHSEWINEVKRIERYHRFGHVESKDENGCMKCAK